MKISKRRYEKKLAEVRWEALGKGQLRGSTEVLDIACSHLGLTRHGMKHNPSGHNALLYAQAYLEGQRLISYFYEASEVEAVTAFSNRFYDTRMIPQQPATQNLSVAICDI
jgi:hypothetical protein